MAFGSNIYRVIEKLMKNPGPVDHTVLNAGNTTITKPTGASGAVVFPDPNGTAVFILKGVAGDTGITLDNRSPCVITVGGASFVINTSANTFAGVVWFRNQ